MSETKAVEFKLRFTFAGRLLLLLTVVVAVVLGWLALFSIAEVGISFPVFLPFAIGAGGGAVFYGLMRLVFRVGGIQFWSDRELERRANERLSRATVEEGDSPGGEDESVE